jgi:Phosphodiester glycosidase
MPGKNPFTLLVGVLSLPFLAYGLVKGLPALQSVLHLDTPTPASTDRLKFLRVDQQGQPVANGANYVLIFDPQSEALDFKVSVALSHPLYAKNAEGKLRKGYVPKRFHEIIADDNAKLDGRAPIAAINADYIDIDNRPQGFNVSRGVEYSGDFRDLRSSFGISGGPPHSRVATIQRGDRPTANQNFNVVGGNGRFYSGGKFRDICDDLGEYACKHETNRSLVAITSLGQVIWLVNNSPANQQLFPSQFDDVLEGIATVNHLGTIRDGMLFDGGLSTGFYFNGTTYVENANPIGSVFLIYSHP